MNNTINLKSAIKLHQKPSISTVPEIRAEPNYSNLDNLDASEIAHLSFLSLSLFYFCYFSVRSDKCLFTL